MPPHDHNHGHCDTCSHDDHEGEATALAYNLYQKVDTQNFQCLNEAIDGSGVKILKPWDQRLNTEVFVESDCDAELLMNIPFTGDVKLTGIAIFASPELHQIRLYKSKMSLSFDDMGAEPDQEFALGDNSYTETDLIQLPVKPTKFSNVHHLTIHLVNKERENEDKPCKIFFLGFKGMFTATQRDAIVLTSYELRPTENLLKNLKENIREVQ